MRGQIESVSVVAPCRNEIDHVGQFLESVARQGYPKSHLELLVVDGMSTDGTRGMIGEFARDHAWVRLVDNPDLTVPHAMNRGIAQASGEIIVRMDMHTRYPEHYVETLLRLRKELAASNIGGVCMTEARSNSAIALAIASVLSSRFGVGGSLFRTGVSEPKDVDTVPFGCFSKDDVVRLGGYDERLIRNQDIELNSRILRDGGRIVLVPDTYSVYSARDRLRPFLANAFQNGLWNVLTIYHTGAVGGLGARHFAPLLFVLILSVAMIGAVFHGAWIWILVGTILLHLAVGVRYATRDRIAGASRPVVALCYLLLHIAYGVGSIAGLIRASLLFVSSPWSPRTGEPLPQERR
jgi:glycosyltransferase involved in cell wall biosynthesis